MKTIQSSAYGGRLKRTWTTGNNDREEEEDAGGGVTDELAELRGNGGGGFSLFSTEDLASRDLCVPVYMGKTKKKRRRQIQKKLNEKKILYKLQPTSHGTL